MYAKSNWPRGAGGARPKEALPEHGPVYDAAGSCLKVFIGGLGHDVSEEAFRGFFEQVRLVGTRGILLLEFNSRLI